MKAICSSIFNRPDLLRQTLEHIVAAHPTGWTLFHSLEPATPPSYEPLIASFPTLTIHSSRHPTRLGSTANGHRACRLAIEAGATSILYMDDDIHLSPDALTLCNWYLSRPLTPADLGIALCRLEGNNPSHPCAISTTDTQLGHYCQGWFFTRSMWFEFVNPNWFHPKFTHDWNLCRVAQEQKRLVLRPRWARARHAGAIGFHGPGIGAFPDSISDGTCRDYYLES